MSFDITTNDARQQTLSGERAVPKPHLTMRQPDHSSSTLRAHRHNEYWCSECQRRITVSSSSGREYGHAAGRGEGRVTCSHAIGVEVGGVDS